MFSPCGQTQRVWFRALNYHQSPGVTLVLSGMDSWTKRRPCGVWRTHINSIIAICIDGLRYINASQTAAQSIQAAVCVILCSSENHRSHTFIPLFIYRLRMLLLFLTVFRCSLTSYLSFPSTCALSALMPEPPLQNYNSFYGYCLMLFDLCYFIYIYTYV